MSDDVNPAARGAWEQSESLTLLRETMGLTSCVRARITTTTNLSDTEVRTLELLSREAIGAAAIARLLDVSTGGATGILNRLEAKGYIERQPHSRDRRRTELALTDYAHREVISHMNKVRDALASNDASLSEHERAVVVRYLRGAVVAVSAL